MCGYKKTSEQHFCYSDVFPVAPPASLIIYLLPYQRKPNDFRGLLVRVVRLERTVSWSQTGTENFFRTFPMIFHHFRSYSVTLVPSFEPPFPPVPRVSVVIHVVKNASRSKEREAFSMFKVSAL